MGRRPDPPWGSWVTVCPRGSWRPWRLRPGVVRFASSSSSGNVFSTQISLVIGMGFSPEIWRCALDVSSVSNFSSVSGDYPDWGPWRVTSIRGGFDWMTARGTSSSETFGSRSCSSVWSVHGSALSSVHGSALLSVRGSALSSVRGSARDGARAIAFAIVCVSGAGLGCGPV